MDESAYESKENLKAIAQEVLDVLKTKELPIWQAKEVLRFASTLADWTKLK